MSGHQILRWVGIAALSLAGSSAWGQTVSPGETIGLYTAVQGAVQATHPGQPGGIQTNADWAYQGHRFTFGLGIPPVYATTLDLGFTYYRQDYDNPNSFSSTGTLAREDDILAFTGTVSRNILSDISAALQYAYVRDQANIAGFDYNRSIFSLTLTGTFDGQF